MAGVFGNPPGTWSQWSLLKGCHNNGINGPSKKQFIRTCLNSPCTGQRYYADYDCSSGYIVPGAIVGVYGRDQCGLNPEKPCNSGENFDGEFYLDLPNMKFDDNKRIQLFIKSKLGTNDKPDLALYHNIPSQSFGANGHLRVNLIIDGDNELPFHKKVSRQFVWYRLESAAKEFNTDQITTLGNRFGLIILSQVTFNPSNEQKTHLSVGFDLGHKHLSSPERVISVIQMTEKSESPGSTPR
ncbi:uncharacterized protein [Clytia hemisphaerica]|uniref:uncharacterized protein n=1 Tax=Clytia hemisphaerica TaxID=252671 RepID=UPI0034D6D7AC